MFVVVDEEEAGTWLSVVPGEASFMEVAEVLHVLLVRNLFTFSGSFSHLVKFGHRAMAQYLGFSLLLFRL